MCDVKRHHTVSEYTLYLRAVWVKVLSYFPAECSRPRCVGRRQDVSSMFWSSAVINELMCGDVGVLWILVLRNIFCHTSFCDSNSRTETDWKRLMVINKVWNQTGVGEGVCVGVGGLKVWFVALWSETRHLTALQRRTERVQHGASSLENTSSPDSASDFRNNLSHNSLPINLPHSAQFRWFLTEITAEIWS